jgi:choline dehydrogenase-like flavoprotein
MSEYDVIVAGSGITGGWAAKELTERGLRVLMLERGPWIEHRKDYTTEFKPPWELPFRGFSDPKVLATSKRIQRGARTDEWTEGMFVDDDIDIYETPPESQFQWIRGYHLGGRSLMWGRHSYRMSPLHFKENARDGHGVPWPFGYEELAPWYDHVERYIGVNGTMEGDLPGLPDGHYQPSMGFTTAEQRLADVIAKRYPERRLIPGRTANLTQPIGDRSACNNRNQCARGCSFGAYFSTQSSTLPAARATGRLTVRTDSIVESLEYDTTLKRVTGVRVLDARSGAGSVVRAKLVFLCTGSINSLGVLLRSASSVAPRGLGNSSGLLGCYVMDHAFAGIMLTTVPGIGDQMYQGRKPNGIVLPRFVNIHSQETDFLRGYSYQGASGRDTWKRAGREPGIGATFKESLRKPGDWIVGFGIFAECLPRRENQARVNFSRKDKYGLPLMHIDVRWSENERKAAAHARSEARNMLGLLGGEILPSPDELAPPGTAIHEMGGACMGDDPRASVLNRHNQLHDAPNVFVTDGACMNSCGDRNPSLSYMAVTARAAAHAAELFKAGTFG